MSSDIHANIDEHQSYEGEGEPHKKNNERMSEPEDGCLACQDEVGGSQQGRQAPRHPDHYMGTETW